MKNCRRLKSMTGANQDLERTMNYHVHPHGVRASGIIAHDDEWQFPAITEQNAYNMVKEHLFDVTGVVYLAFPWATLLDKYNTKRSAALPLLKKLKELTLQIAPNTRVVTVCQHIHMMKFIDIFFDHRVTDIFWTHAVKNEFSVSADRKIDLHPFPLYSVQFSEKEAFPVDQKRQHLFSFIGARANQWYLTESRNWILDLLGDDSRGLVVGRDAWHFNKIVYDYQIRKNSETTDKLVDQDATEQFKQTLRETTFALCPSGSGPNSIRLWESIGAGSIPVILADTYLTPGRAKLWKEAVVYCEESPEEIKALPNRLEAIAKDPELLAHKRKMLSQLWMLYGTNPFIYDIQLLYVRIANGDFTDSADLLGGHGEGLDLNQMAELILSKDKSNAFELSMFLNICISHLMINPQDFEILYAKNASTRTALAKVLKETSNTAAVDRFERAKILSNFDEARVKPKHEVARCGDPIKVFLHGKHSNRTPLSYQPYLAHAKKYINIVESAEQADLIMTGFNIDYASDTATLRKQKLDNYKTKHVVFSEEPLWDVIWSKGYKDQQRKIPNSISDLSYDFLNHMNTDIYAFDKIPYFITTDDKYFVRYGNLARRNVKMSTKDLLTHWSSAPTRSAFYAEIRDGENYGVSFEDDDIYGLCPMRTSVARNCKKGTIIRVGGGWPRTEKKRQALPDWHLDKLNELDNKTMIVSAFENTHQKHYITEKIFDAFAVNAIPIYFASPNHRIHELFPDGGFINVFGMTGEEAAKYVDNFQPDEVFANNYLKSQKRMVSLFSDPTVLIRERQRLVAEFVKVAKEIISI